MKKILILMSFAFTALSNLSFAGELKSADLPGTWFIKDVEIFAGGNNHTDKTKETSYFGDLFTSHTGLVFDANGFVYYASKPQMRNAKYSIVNEKIVFKSIDAAGKVLETIEATADLRDGKLMLTFYFPHHQEKFILVK